MSSKQHLTRKKKLLFFFLRSKKIFEKKKFRYLYSRSKIEDFRDLFTSIAVVKVFCYRGKNFVVENYFILQNWIISEFKS